MDVIANNSSAEMLRSQATTLRKQADTRACGAEELFQKARAAADEAASMRTLADEYDAAATRLSA